MRFWYILIPIVQKGKKFVTFALISTHGTTMVLHKEGVYRDGTYDRWESDCHLIFLDITILFVTEAGNALAALGNIHEGDSHILK
jgi:hypothetical protein